MRVTLPLVLLTDKNVSSLKELKARRKDIEANRETLDAVQNLREVFESWNNFALEQDDTNTDHAAHQKGLVVLDEHTQPNRYDKQKVIGEWQAGPDGKVVSSSFEVTRSFDGINPQSTSELSYKRTADKETFHEKVAGKQLKLVLDHKKGTLTYLDTLHQSPES